MSGFSIDWLGLREAFDHRAREAAIDAFALPALARQWRDANADGGLSVVDLACGSGSNLRALAPRLGPDQRWRLVDHDPALLAAAPAALARWAEAEGYAWRGSGDGAIGIAGLGFSAEVTLEALDLANDLHRLALAGTQLVTASALLDLVSAAWLATLVRLARDARAAMLFALSVDGRVAWSPADPSDAAIHRLFDAHQRRDKGFGPALGRQAPALASRLMDDAGYLVQQASSDWAVEGSDAMLAAMIDGTAEAAKEQALPSGRPAVDAWRARRHAMRRSTRLEVGHIDLFAALPFSAANSTPSNRSR